MTNRQLRKRISIRPSPTQVAHHSFNSSFSAFILRGYAVLFFLLFFLGISVPSSIGQCTTSPVTTNNGLRFDGTNDYVKINSCSNGIIFPGGDAITIEYWFKGTNMQSAVRMQTVSGNYIVAGWSNSKHILSNDGGTAGGVAVGAGANDGSWHHVAMTWQRNTVNGFKSYLDGTLVQQINSANVALPSFSTDVYLGAFSGTSEFTNGTLDEVRVWTVARTQTQIQLGQYTCSPADQTGLLMFYRFNQGAVNSANVGITGLLNGTSSNDLHGVLTNFDLTTTTNWVTGFPLSVGISIVTSPTLSGSQCVGNTPTLTAKATSNGLTIVTWQYKAAGASNYTDIETRAYTSNTDVTYTIPPLSITDNGAMYRAVFKGFCGAVVTDAVTVTFGPTRLYVKANATGSNTGLDWTNAFTDLQSALNYACSGALTEIWVAKGTYKPSSTGNRTTSFVLLPNVKIYGSFAGNEASLSQRTPSVRTANTSILSGDLLDNDVISGSGISLSITGNDENSRVVILNNFTSTNPLTSAAMLDGFTISGGNADGVVADYQGGGMYNNYASPSLNNLTFSGNNAGFQGGAMYNNYASPSLNNVVFSRNKATSVAGGMFNLYSSPSLNNVTFSGNYGGGMLNGISSPSLNDVTFSGNYGYRGGGMYNNSSNPALNNVIFSGNEGTEGGGMHNTGGSSPSLSNVTFLGNNAQLGGGMLNLTSCSPSLSNVIFSGNSATEGGGMYNLAAAPNLSNVTFSGNSATEGGGMYNLAAAPNLSNVTFSGNSATVNGGGMSNASSSSPTIKNSIFWGNTRGGSANVGGADIVRYDYDSHAPPITNTVLQLAIGSYGNEYPNIAVNNNLFGQDPFFVNAANPAGADGIFRTADDGLALTACSPAINTGNNAGIATTDIVGNPRIFGGTVDMGAYELQVNQTNNLTINTHPSVAAGLCFYLYVGNTLILTAKATTSSPTPTTIVWQKQAAGSDSFVNIGSPQAYTSATDALYTFNLANSDNGASYRAMFAFNCGAVIQNRSTTAVSLNVSASPSPVTSNNALNFDGTNDYVTINSCSNGVIFPGGKEITIEYWFKGTHLQSPVRMQHQFGFIVSGWTGNTVSAIPQHIISNGGSGTTGLKAANSTAALYDNNWHHVAMTWQQGFNFTSYLDGVLIDQRAVSATAELPIFDRGVYLGAWEGTNEFMNGTLNEVRVWTVARTQAQIKASANKCTPLSLSLPQTGLLMYYKFDHGVANSANAGIIGLLNSAGSDLNGTLNNFDLTAGTSNWVNTLPIQSEPTRLYVKANATGSNTGLDWTNAFTDLQSALNYTCTSVLTEIWVAKGTYKPSSIGDFSASFTLLPNVKIYGSFVGNESSLSQRTPSVIVTNTAILSGDLSGNDGANFVNYSDNSFHVISNINNGLTTANSLIDGFTITGGNANGSPLNERGGGGMYNISSSPSLSNVTFSGNDASLGGGVYNFTSSPSLSNVTFSGNHARLGGGMYNDNSSSPSLSNVTFSNNNARVDGGGLYNSYSSPSLSNVTFSNNNAPNIGGGLYNSYSAISLSNVTFSGNNASVGGGMYTELSSSPSLNNVTFSGNNADFGGGMYNNFSSLIIKNSIFWGNKVGGTTVSSIEGDAAVVSYSDIEGGYAGTGNINQDPLFVNVANPAGSDGIFRTADDGLALSPCSPAFNVGDNTGVASTDIVGNPRIFGSAVDMGAYELQSNPITVSPTTTNNALNFDGTNDYVQINKCSGSVFAGGDAITIEYWFKGSSNQSAVRMQDNGQFIVAGWNGTHILSNDGGLTGISAGTGYTNGNWHHIAMTWQRGGFFTSYLDGNQVAQRAASNTPLPVFNAGVYLGSLGGIAEFMNGSLDEVRVWTVARTQAQIQANLSACTLLDQTNLLMYYRFDHGATNGTNTSINTLLNSVNSTELTGVLNGFSLSSTSSNWVTGKSCGLAIAAKVFLQGAYNTTTHLMRDDLRSKNLIPLLESYTGAATFTHFGNGGNERTNTTVLSFTGNNAIIDWVFVELRDPSVPSTILYTRSALLQADGDIVDVDGVSPLIFNAPANNYYLGIRHRNHLIIQTTTPISLNSTTTTSADFSDLIANISSSKMNELDNRKVMRGGDLNNNGDITAFDVSKVRQANITGQSDSYKIEDVNMNGQATAFDVSIVRRNNKPN